MSATDLSYYMGQGKAYLATRIAGGIINGPFLFVGDCPMIGLGANEKFDDVEESTSGSRLVAAHIPVGLAYDAKIQMNQWSAANLQRASRGGVGRYQDLPKAAASVSAEINQAWGGGLMGLANPGISSVVLALGGAATTLASIGVSVGGSGVLAQGTSVPLVFVGMTATTAPTANAIIGPTGAIDHVEVTSVGSGVSVLPTSATVAGVTSPTFTFNAGATALVLTTDYTIDAANGAITFVSAANGKVPSGLLPSSVGIPVTAAYNYASWTSKTEALLTGIQEYCLRVQGLNTANGNAPVIITIWRYSMNLVKNLELIASKHGTLDLDGMMLPDVTRDGISQSQWYTVQKV